MRRLVQGVGSHDLKEISSPEQQLKLCYYDATVLDEEREMEGARISVAPWKRKREGYIRRSSVRCRRAELRWPRQDSDEPV